MACQNVVTVASSSLISSSATCRCRDTNKPPSAISNIHVVDFQQRLRSSEFFIDPVDTPDEYLNQLVSTVTAILDEVAPIRHGTRPDGRMAAKWLEPEAVSVQQHWRQFERRYKKSGSEQDRVAYRASCRRANLLINSSRNKHQNKRWPR